MFFRYVLGSLAARKISNGVAVLSIGLVIAASVLSVAFYDGLKENLAATGRPDNVVVVASGVLQTSKSVLPKVAFEKLEVLPLVAKKDGVPLVSREAHLTVDMNEEGTEVAPARGVEPIAFDVHDQVKIVDGRNFQKGSNELIIGKKMVGRAEGWTLGGSIQVGGEKWPIVGVFSAAGSALENEVWGDRSRLGMQVKHPDIASAVVRATSQQDMPELIKSINELRLGEGNGGAFGISEREYYETTLGNVSTVIAAVAGVIIILMMGATFAAANTLHASLSSRMSEFAALWVLGSKRARLALLIFQEALLISVSAALLACLIGLLCSGVQVSELLGGAVEFALPFGHREVGAAFALAAAIGLLGTIYPGIQVLRRNLAEDLG